MKKEILFKIFLLIGCVLPVTVAAQDIIYKADGTRVESKVQEVGVNEIRYKLFNNPDGPVYVVEKDKVILIAYQNGAHETFGGRSSKVRSNDSDSLSLNKHKNIISVNMFDLVFTNISLSYERIFGDGMLGIKVPVSIGLKSLEGGEYPTNGSFLLTRKWGTGIDINIYPMRQSRVTYFLGPSFIIGAYTQSYYYWHPYPWPYINTGHNMHYAFVLNNGVMVQPTKNINITMALGLGLKQDQTAFDDNYEPKGNFSVNFGYRF